MTDFGLVEYQKEEGILILAVPAFDFDTFPELGERLVSLLSASVIEKQLDADIHSWLIDFEGCRLMLKAEHYSESVWLEAVFPDDSVEELNYLGLLFKSGI